MIYGRQGKPGEGMQLLLGAKPARVFRFLWVTKTGPRVRCFSSLEAFSGYVAEVRALCGVGAVDFRTPVLCVGVV